MDLKVHWTQFAESELDNIFRYYEKEVNPKVAYDIVEGIFKEALSCQNNQKWGKSKICLEVIMRYSYI